MATHRYDAAFRIEEGEAMRWWRMTAVALVSVFVWTVILGLMLAPRWPELPSLATSGRNQQPIALPSSAAKQLVAPADTGETAALGSESSTDSSKPATVRPKAYSSIDAQTLAVARARGEVLAGKRAPVTDSAPSVAARENDATAVPPVVADEQASRVSGSSDRTSSSSPRFDVSQSSASALEPVPATSPRVESSTVDSSVGSSRSPNARAVLPRLPSPRRASPGTPTSRVELAQTAPSEREVKRVAPISRSEVSQWPSPRSDPPRLVRVTPANGANWPEDRDTSMMQGPTRAAPPSPQQDAAAARLDDSWERRERWLRERLRTR